jgi:hypothetical protein
MYELSPAAADVRIFGGGGGGGGEAQRFFRLLRAEAARLVLKLRAGAGAAGCWSWSAARGGLPGHRRSALGGRINELKGQNGEQAGMPLGVVAGIARGAMHIV